MFNERVRVGSSWFDTTESPGSSSGDSGESSSPDVTVDVLSHPGSSGLLWVPLVTRTSPGACAVSFFYEKPLSLRRRPGPPPGPLRGNSERSSGRVGVRPSKTRPSLRFGRGSWCVWVGEERPTQRDTLEVGRGSVPVQIHVPLRSRMT